MDRNKDNIQDGVEELYFSEHTNPRLTFVIGVVAGISIMTMSGIAFFSYTLSGADIQPLEVTPLESSHDLLEEPRSTLTQTTEGDITITDDTHISGAVEDYSVTLVRYVDYECLFCKKFFPTLREFVATRNDTVRYIVKHYPLTQIHPQAKSAAIAAECAGEQDTFLEYSDKLFEKQSELSTAVYLDIATELELDIDVFGACLDNPTIEQRVENDVAEALELGITSQPNLVIWREGEELELIDGYVNTEYLESIIVN